MSEHVIKLPDVGEGVAEAELVEWHVKVGELVREDTVLAAVMTDKATVEIPSPVDGKVIWLGAEIGESVPVGSPLVRLEGAGDGKTEAGEAAGAPRPGAPMQDEEAEAPVADGIAAEGETLPPPPKEAARAPARPAPQQAQVALAESGQRIQPQPTLRGAPRSVG